MSTGSEKEKSYAKVIKNKLGRKCIGEQGCIFFRLAKIWPNNKLGKKMIERE